MKLNISLRIPMEVMDHDTNSNLSCSSIIISIVYCDHRQSQWLEKFKNGRIWRTWDSFYFLPMRLWIWYASWKPPGCTTPTLIHYEFTKSRSRLVHLEFTIPSNKSIYKSVCHGQEAFNSSPEFFGRSTMPGRLGQSIRSSVIDERLRLLELAPAVCFDSFFNQCKCDSSILSI